MRRGFTLLEVIVASALFVVAGLVVFGMFQWGLKSMEVGKMNMEAQQTARDVLRTLKTEISTAIRLNLPVEPRAFPSAVVFPSCAVKESTNDVYFVTSTRSAAAMDTSRADNYRIVRFTSTGNQFFKEEYLVQQGIGATAPSGFSYAAGEGAGDHWMLTPTSLPANPRQTLVAELAGSNDLINFKISHAAVDATHDTFFAGYPIGTFSAGPYDRLIFKIEVDATRYYRNDRKSQASTKTLSDTVTIPDFTQ